MVTVSPPVSPSVVLMIQKINVTSGTLLRACCLLISFTRDFRRSRLGRTLERLRGFNWGRMPRAQAELMRSDGTCVREVHAAVGSLARQKSWERPGGWLLESVGAGWAEQTGRANARPVGSTHPTG